MVKEAGERICHIYIMYKDYKIEMKEDQTPITIADKESNEILTSNLTKLCPEIPILSEEGEIWPFEERKKWEYFWLIDPLDGTKEFILKNGQFTVGVALIKDNKPIFGVVYLPVDDTFYFGYQGLGAYRFEGRIIDKNLHSLDEILKHSLRLPIIKKESEEKIKVVVSRSRFSKGTKQFIQILRKFYKDIEIIPIGGSLLKFCLLSEGYADIYPRVSSPVAEWDAAAGQIILEESGGKVIDLTTTKPITYNKEEQKIPPFIAQREGFEFPVPIEYIMKQLFEQNKSIT
jgi:3'(2'), 5'-bisphosphate nucleotidase